MTQKNFSFAKKFSLPLYFVSAADGTNVVKVLANQRQSADAAYGSWSSREKGRERGETRTVSGWMQRRGTRLGGPHLVRQSPLTVGSG